MKPTSQVDIEMCVCCGRPQWIDDDNTPLCECSSIGWCEMCDRCCEGCTCVDVEDFEEHAAAWKPSPKTQGTLFATDRAQ